MHMLQLLSALREIYKHVLTITHNKNYYRNNNTDRCSIRPIIWFLTFEPVLKAILFLTLKFNALEDYFKDKAVYMVVN